jgi:chemotaxis response regulator CheB
MNQDVIAIDASAGGVEVLLEMAGGLPNDLPASVLVAMHTSPAYPSALPDLLSHRGPLPARHPLHREKILAGHSYIAPPDNHLLVREGEMQVVRGPKENRHRPAADALFRTAPFAYDPLSVSAFEGREPGAPAVLIRALEEGAALSRRLARSSTGAMRHRFEETARGQDQEADVLRRIVLHGASVSVDDAGKV